MVNALCLMFGVLLGEATLMPPVPTGAAKFLPPAALDTNPASPPNPTLQASDQEKAGSSAPQLAEPKSESNKELSIFSHMPFSDRGTLSFITGAGPGRFNIIDLEERPHADRFWSTARWYVPNDMQWEHNIGFNVHWWSGPVQDGLQPGPDLPPYVFDLYLELSWSQNWNDWLKTQVRIRPGMYTDFRTTPPDSFRAPGEAIGVAQASDELYFVAGVQYLQRNNVKLLPVAGFLWQPMPQWEIALVFPEPKIACELSAKDHLWGYVAAEYGGGRWTYNTEADHAEHVEYSDYRVMLGIEWRQDGPHGMPVVKEKSAAFLEAGYIFERQLRLAEAASRFDPKPAWMIRIGRVW